MGTALPKIYEMKKKPCDHLSPNKKYVRENTKLKAPNMNNTNRRRKKLIFIVETVTLIKKVLPVPTDRTI